MPDAILFYISASPDLELEREVLGRVPAEIPTTLAWRVFQTPSGDEPLNLDAAAHSDVHILIMGSDVRAPVGVEWMAAQQAGRIPALFVREGISHTPAGAMFVHELERYAAWQLYSGPADLRRQVIGLLTGFILKHARDYRIGPEEFDRLREWQKQIEADKAEVDKTRGGAGASSVVLSPERFVPSQGKLIRGPEPDRTASE